MAKSTKNTYKPSRKGNYKPVIKMNDGGNVSELNYSERAEYIEEHYAPFIKEAQMIFTIYGEYFEYDYKKDRKEVVNEIIEHYKSIADYTEETLPQETIYEIQDWEIVRREIDPETDEVYDKTELEEITADNTYNFSYLGLVDLNWRVYYDADYERYFYVIMPHLGGDIRGNYGDAIILEGNDKEELFYRFYENFVSGGASIYFQFADGSEVGFDSESDSDVFNFRLNEIFEPTGMAEKFVADFEKFDTWKGDEFVEETLDIFLMRQGKAPKMMAGGKLDDETPKAYIEILGYNEGTWLDLSDFADGNDVIEHIQEWMDSLNEELGGNRAEYEVTDYEGFGDNLYDRYMGENEFDEIIQAYENYQNSDFPSGVITAYINDVGGSSNLADTIEEMDNNFFGKYESYEDFGYEMVEQGVYSPTISDVFLTDTTKRVLAGDEADSIVGDMYFDDMLEKADTTREEYNEEKNKLEERYEEIETDISDLQELQEETDDQDEYDRISEEIEEKELLLEEIQTSLDDIDSRYEDNARREAQDIIYDEIYDRLENDLEGWLEDYGYAESDLQDISFISIDYEAIGEDLANDYLIVEYDREMYFFNNYAKGGRIKATKNKPKYQYYIVENNTKKLVSGYNTKAEAVEQRALLVKEYPSMRFEIFTLGNLEKKTDLDVYAKKDYVELSTLDKIKQVSVDAYRYGQEKVGQANQFLKKHDVKGKIKRGATKVWDKTKQGASWLQRQWREADFGDGKGKAKFFDDGGEILWVDNFELDQDKINRAKYIIKYNRGIYTIIDNKTKKAITSFPTQISAVKYINTELNKFADGGRVNSTRYNLYFNYNPSNLSNEDAENIVSKYTKDWKHNNDWDEISFYVFGLTEEKANELKAELNGYDTYNVEIDKSRYNDGGMAGLGEVSGMLPSPLPMSVIQPMADGGGVNSLQIKNNKPLLDKILETLNQWCVTYKLIGSADETPRYSQLMYDYDAEKWMLKSTQKNLFYYIDGLTKEEMQLLKMIGRINPNDLWNQYKEIRTEFLLENHPTIDAYKDGGDVLTKPRPVTTPAPTKTPSPSKPDRNNPYKPKTTPKPKASKYDYIWIVE